MHNRLTKIGGQVKRKNKRKVLETKKREGRNNYKKKNQKQIFFLIFNIIDWL